jgi:hypothetical protein
MFLMPARYALEVCLALAIGFLAMTADGARPAGISGIDCDHIDSRKLGLVLDKTAKLKEGPTVHPCSLPLSKRCPLTDVLEILKSNAASGVFSGPDKRLADAMIDVPAILGFLPPHADNRLVARSARPAFGSLGLLADRSTSAQGGDSFRFNFVRLVKGSIGIDGDVIRSQINTDEISGQNWRLLGDIHRDDEKPLAVITENKISLSLLEGEPISLVLAHDEGNDDAAIQRADAYAIDPFEADVLAHRIGHGGMLAKLGSFVLVSLVGITDLREASAGHVSRQTELLPEIAISNLVQIKGPSDFVLEGDASQPVSGLIEPLNGRSQFESDRNIRQELSLEHEFHASVVWLYSPYVTTGGGNSPVA